MVLSRYCSDLRHWSWNLTRLLPSMPVVASSAVKTAGGRRTESSSCSKGRFVGVVWAEDAAEALGGSAGAAVVGGAAAPPSGRTVLMPPVGGAPPAPRTRGRAAAAAAAGRRLPQRDRGLGGPGHVPQDRRAKSCPRAVGSPRAGGQGGRPLWRVEGRTVPGEWGEASRGGRPARYLGRCRWRGNRAPMRGRRRIR